MSAKHLNVLGLTEEATEEEVKRKYKTLAMKVTFATCSVRIADLLCQHSGTQTRISTIFKRQLRNSKKSVRPTRSTRKCCFSSVASQPHTQMTMRRFEPGRDDDYYDEDEDDENDGYEMDDFFMHEMFRFHILHELQFCDWYSLSIRNMFEDFMNGNSR